MCPNGRNCDLMVVGVDESSKSPMFDPSQDIEKNEEQMGNNLVENQTPRGGPTRKGCY